MEDSSTRSCWRRPQPRSPSPVRALIRWTRCSTSRRVVMRSASERRWSEWLSVWRSWHCATCLRRSASVRLRRTEYERRAGEARRSYSGSVPVTRVLLLQSRRPCFADTGGREDLRAASRHRPAHDLVHGVSVDRFVLEKELGKTVELLPALRQQLLRPLFRLAQKASHFPIDEPLGVLCVPAAA